MANQRLRLRWYVARLTAPMFPLMVLLAGTRPAVCQDLVLVAPQAAKVEYEDARLRIVRLRVAPNAPIPMHDRPARVVIPLTTSEVITTRADGTTSVARSVAGKPAWSEPGRRSYVNGDAPVENIVVELKKVAGPAKGLTHAPDPLPVGYLKDSFHQWLFENQYVRVYDVRIPPGATTDYHAHALDTVHVTISGALTAAQLQGQAWGPAKKSESGSVRFDADAKQPYTHRVRNDGAGEYHAIAVQFLQ